MLIGNLCKFDHCAVGLVVEGGGVQDLRRRFAMGRSEQGRARLGEAHSLRAGACAAVGGAGEARHELAARVLQADR